MIEVVADVFHNNQPITRLSLEYAGRVNVFQADFAIPQVNKDYEVLDVRVSASQNGVANFGFHRRTFKLTP